MKKLNNEKEGKELQSHLLNPAKRTVDGVADVVAARQQLFLLCQSQLLGCQKLPLVFKRVGQLGIQIAGRVCQVNVHLLPHPPTKQIIKIREK